jgi:hypothetical protein
MTDRPAGPQQGPYVAKEPRSRNKDGSPAVLLVIERLNRNGR